MAADQAAQAAQVRVEFTTRDADLALPDEAGQTLVSTSAHCYQFLYIDANELTA